MGKTADQLGEEMSSAELTGWMAYERRYGPIGPEREDFHAALVCATVANLFRAKGRRAKVEDFLPKWDAEPLPPETLLAKWQAFRAGLADRTAPGPPEPVKPEDD